jgi:hypothetical protein
MPRPRERVCLQDGLKLDLNCLARRGFVRRGANIGLRGIRWTHSYWGEIATGTISADMSGPHEGWFRIQLGSLDQRIILVPRARHFGGRQWYFMCPVKNRPVSVLWKPNGDAILQQADLGQASRLPIPIQRRDEPGSRRERADQITADCRSRSRRMGSSAQAEMDAVDNLQPLFGPTRPLRRRSGSRSHSNGGKIPWKIILFEINGGLQVSW